MALQVHLIDGTYELFRHFYGAKRAKPAAAPDANGAVAAGGDPAGGAPAFDAATPNRGGSAADPAVPDFLAVRGVLVTVLQMLESGATHLGVATDHVIESFRNALWPAYKTGAGIDPALAAQFEPLEVALAAMGVAVWPMVDFEADDALASAAAIAARDPGVDQVCIWTPDKDLAQCVRGRRVVQVDRRSGQIRDEDAVIERFGVPPASIPDYLALVGDSADGFPGLPGWGARSAATVLRRFGHIEDVPARAADWGIRVVSAPRLAATLAAEHETALLFRRLATLRTDIDLFDDVGALRWTGPTIDFERAARELGAPQLAERAHRAAPQPR